MAAIASATRQANQGPRGSVAKTAPCTTARPGRTSRSVLSPSTAHKRQFAHRTVMPAVTKSRARARTSAATAPYSSMLHCYIRALIVTTHQPPLTNHAEINRQPRRLETIVTLTKQTPATQINRKLLRTLHPALFAGLATSRITLRGSLATSHEPQVTSRGRSNRHTSRLENAISRRKQTLGTPSNRHFLQVSASHQRRIAGADHLLHVARHIVSNRQWQILEFNVTHTKQTTAPRSNRQFLRCLNLQIQQSQQFHRTRAALKSPAATLDFQPSPVVSNRNNTSFKIAGNSLKINIERNPNRNTNRELRLAPRNPRITNHAFSPQQLSCRIGAENPMTRLPSVLLTACGFATALAALRRLLLRQPPRARPLRSIYPRIGRN